MSPAAPRARRPTRARLRAGGFRSTPTAKSAAGSASRRPRTWHDSSACAAASWLPRWSSRWLRIGRRARRPSAERWRGPSKKFALALRCPSEIGPPSRRCEGALAHLRLASPPCDPRDWPKRPTTRPLPGIGPPNLPGPAPPDFRPTKTSAFLRRCSSLPASLIMISSSQRSTPTSPARSSAAPPQPKGSARLSRPSGRRTHARLHAPPSTTDSASARCEREIRA